MKKRVFFLLTLSAMMFCIISCEKEEKEEPVKPTDEKVIKKFQIYPYEKCVLRAEIAYYKDSLDKGLFHMEMSDLGENLVPDTSYVYFDSMLIRIFYGNQWEFDTSAYDLICNRHPGNEYDKKHQFLVITHYSRHSEKYNWDYSRHSAQWFMIYGSDSLEYGFFYHESLGDVPDELELNVVADYSAVYSTLTGGPVQLPEINVNNGNRIYGERPKDLLKIRIMNQDSSADWISLWLDDSLELNMDSSSSWSTDLFLDEFPSGKHQLNIKRPYDGIAYRMNALSEIETDVEYRIYNQYGPWYPVLFPYYKTKLL